MTSYIADHFKELRKRHYVRNARTPTYWFDFQSSKVESYRQRYGDNFCLIVNGSDSHDDAYIMPYNEVKKLF